jgi:hypothetical protein
MNKEEFDTLWEKTMAYNAKMRGEEAKWDEEHKDFEFKLLDIVRTKNGTLAVVSELNTVKSASLAFAKDTHQKIAWYHPSELRVIGNVQDLVGLLEEKK